MSLEELEQAKRTWEEKRAYYECELSIDSDPAKKFELRKRIEECQKEIKRIEADRSEAEGWREQGEENKERSRQWETILAITTSLGAGAIGGWFAHASRQRQKKRKYKNIIATMLLFSLVLSLVMWFIVWVRT